MVFQSRREALLALGLTEGADMAAVKSAYKNLVKKYHPDVRSDAASAGQYRAISDAYEYLMGSFMSEDQAVWAASGSGMQNAGHRIFGTNEELSRMADRMHSRAERAKTEMKLDAQKKDRARELSQKSKEAKAKRIYDETMEKIHTERAAQVMAQITAPAAAMAVAEQDHLQDAEMNGLTDSGMTETETLPTLIRDHGRVILPDGGSRMRADGILSPNGRR